MTMRRALLVSLLLVVACGSGARNIRGTQITDTEDNREILGIVEQYRRAVEQMDTKRLLTMASKSYWEDAGTPSGKDDYGYDGLRDVLEGRFQQASGIRYSMKYMRIRRQDNRAFVEVLIDASYNIETGRGQERLDKRDQNEMVLEHDGQHWKFISGM